MISFDINLFITLLTFIFFVYLNINTNNKYLKKILGRKNKKYIIFIYILFPIILYTILNNFNSTERFTLSSQSVNPTEATSQYRNEIENLAEYMNFGRPKCQPKMVEVCQAIDPNVEADVTTCQNTEIETCGQGDTAGQCEVIESEIDEERFCIRLNNKITRLRTILIMYVMEKEKDEITNAGDFVFSGSIASEAISSGIIPEEQEQTVSNDALSVSWNLISNIKSVVDGSDENFVNQNGVSDKIRYLNPNTGDVITEDQRSSGSLVAAPPSADNDGDDDFLFLRFTGLPNINDLYNPTQNITINQIIEGLAYDSVDQDKRFFGDICLFAVNNAGNVICDYIGPNQSIETNDDGVMGVQSEGTIFKEIRYGLNHCDIANFPPYVPNSEPAGAAVAPAGASGNDSYSDAYERWEAFRANPSSAGLLIGELNEQRPWLIKSNENSNYYMDIIQNQNRLGGLADSDNVDAELARLEAKCNQFPTCSIVDDICQYTANANNFNLQPPNMATESALPLGVSHRRYGRGIYNGFQCRPKNNNAPQEVVNMCEGIDAADPPPPESLPPPRAGMTPEQTAKFDMCNENELCRVRPVVGVDGELMFEESSKTLPLRYFNEYITCEGEGEGDIDCPNIDLENCNSTTGCSLSLMNLLGLCNGNPSITDDGTGISCDSVTPTISETGELTCQGDCEPIGIRDIILPGSENSNAGAGNAGAGNAGAGNAGAGTR